MPSRVVVTTPSEREIRVTRSFDAPAQVVFDFHTKPEHLQKWLLGPPGWSMPVCEVDLRVGGRYHHLWRSDESGREFGVQGVFRQISSPTLIVNSETMDGQPGEVLCTQLFTESGDCTTFQITMLFESPAYRDAALETGMTEGMSMSYDRLEDLMSVSR